jgi:hypothetical protein
LKEALVIMDYLGAGLTIAVDTFENACIGVALEGIPNEAAKNVLLGRAFAGSEPSLYGCT